MKTITCLIAVQLFSQTCMAESHNPRIQIPSNPKLEELYALYPERIEGPLRILVANIKEPKDQQFISASGATKNLKWRASSIIIISSEVVAIKYDEGHIEVVAVYTWNSAHEQWILSTEHGGTLRERAYSETKK